MHRLCKLNPIGSEMAFRLPWEKGPRIALLGICHWRFALESSRKKGLVNDGSSMQAPCVEFLDPAMEAWKGGRRKGIKA